MTLDIFYKQETTTAEVSEKHFQKRFSFEAEMPFQLKENVFKHYVKLLE